MTQLGIANYSLIDESLRGQEILLAEEIPTGTCKSMPDLEEVHEQRHLCVKVTGNVTKKYRIAGKIANEQCSFFPTDQTSSCRSSDSGSPLLSLDNEHPFSPVYLEGILSFRGRPCLGEPVIFTNVDFYLSWILQTMTEL